MSAHGGAGREDEDEEEDDKVDDDLEGNTSLPKKKNVGVMAGVGGKVQGSYSVII